MPFAKTDLEAPMVGSVVITGYRVLGNYRNEYIIAQSANEKSPEPFVVWNLDSEGDPYSGSYFSTLEPAQTEFVSRCFPWFWEQPEPEPAHDPEVLVNFTGVFPTHRVGVYKGWLLVQTYDEADGGVLCYAPNEEWGSVKPEDFSDLSFIKDCYEVEWQAGHLQEAIDFIDGADEVIATG